ncbi:MAG: MBL fold metallo-hydrolase [Cypionkella sp.]
MRIHYLRCGTDCPLGGALFDGFSLGPFGDIPCAAQLVETSEGLVLIDTGYGTDDVRHPHPRLSKFMRGLLNIRFRERETALRQVEALGFTARDVRHIVLTHLDFDHAGGIADFPQARVHLMAAERTAAERLRNGFVARRRYRPAQWNGATDWRTYDAGGGESWFGLDRGPRARRPAAGDPDDPAARPHRRPRGRGGAHGRRLGAERGRCLISTAANSIPTAGGALRGCGSTRR